MATQTYCTAADVIEITGQFAHDVAADDEENGLVSAAEAAHVTNSIERAAALMNGMLGQRYILSELASSDWCKWVNAEWAGMLLLERRNNPGSGSLAANVAQHKETLALIRDGHARVPDVVSSLARRPSISNFDVDRSRPDTPTPVSIEDSTGSPQSPHLKRRIS